METFFYFYIACWVAACLAALGMYRADRLPYVISQPSYWRFLAQPWKLATFTIATAGITLVAPYTGDPTWDYFDAFFMAVLTFATAPWAMGTLYEVIRRRRPARQAYVAFCAWMFSASWSYDIYLVWRDGDYPMTWYANIFASSVLYVSAGLLWSLEWHAGRGVIFAFMHEPWPSPANGTQFSRLFWYALPFMLFGVAAVLYFVLPLPFPSAPK